MNTLHFCKMHGLGNDFIVLDDFRYKNPTNLPITTLSNRQRGIGFDQLLWIRPSKVADVYCQIFNADGSEAEQCGNGMRCIARYMHEEKLATRPIITIETEAGIVEAEVKDYQHIRVKMGIPRVRSDKVSVMLDDPSIVTLTTMSLGNPHAIHRVENLQNIPLDIWAKKIANHVAFPQGVNIGFIEVISRKKICLRTHERGVGETPACGSNTCAAVIAGAVNGWLDNEVEVQVPGGKLKVKWEGNEYPVFLTGSASRVYFGTLLLSDLIILN